MTNLSIDFCQSVRKARRDAGLTQGVLAHEVGCKQSALSMFEQGDGTKLNDSVIEKLAKKFDLKITTSEESAKRPVLPPSVVVEPATGFCPNRNCPSNHQYSVEEKRLYRPDRQAADPVGGKYCAVCGELLERRCPNCGAPVHEGAICSLCGEPYVT